MAVKGKGKQIAGKAPASSPSSSGKRKTLTSHPQNGAASRRKKRRPGVLQFFDDAAADADYDEEGEEDEDLELGDEEIDLGFGNEAIVEGKDVKVAGKSNQLPFFLKEEQLSGDELEELIKDRYGRGSEYVVYEEDPKECDDGVSAVHSATDPAIWRVKCMIGREQQIAFCFMQKYVDLQKFGTKLDIISAFALEHVKGYVYIEADKACDVVEACKGFCNIYSTRMGPVPRNEIPHLLSVRNKACEVSKGAWVRMQNGKYKGDLGQVVAIDDVRKRATIKMVPRIDLQAIAKKFGGGISLKQAAVPPPRLINRHELEHFRPHIVTKRDKQTGEEFEYLDGLMLKDGYVYKKVSISSLVCWGVEPSEDERLKFTDMSKGEDDDVSWLSSVYDVRKKMKASKTSDREGSGHKADYKGSCSKGSGSKGSDHKGSGHKGSDHKWTSKEGNDYDLHDLVLFGKKSFGVIVTRGKDGIQILKGDAEGQETVTVKEKDIKHGCVDKMFTASDCHGKTISINDIVKVVEGPLEGRQGPVRHMYRGTLFIYDESQPENSGFFGTKSELCENIKLSKVSSFQNTGGKASTSFVQSPVRSCEQEDSSQTFNRYRRSETNQTFSIGQSLRINKGPLKGYLCRVVGIYRSDVTVKLDSLVKVITVEEQFLSVPNLKRDNSSTETSNIFGSQERQPIGGLSDDGRAPMGLSSWSGGRDSWQPLSSTSFSFAINNNQNPDQEQGSDPWGSKLKIAEDQEQGSDPWGSKLKIAAEDKEQGADPWGNSVQLLNKDQGEADPWGKKLAPGHRDQEQGADPWGSKVPHKKKDQELGADPWSSNSVPGGRDQEGADPWGSKAVLPMATDKEQSADPWGSKVALASRDKEAADPWNSKVPAGDSSHSDKAMDSWSKPSNACGNQSSWNKDAGGSKEPDIRNQPATWEKNADCWKNSAVKSATGSDRWEQSSNQTCPDNNANNKVDAWNSKGKGVTGGEEDSWGKLSNRNKGDDSVLDRWDGPRVSSHCDSLKSSCSFDVWDKAATDKNVGKGEERSSNWARPDVDVSDKVDAWNSKGKGVAGSKEAAWGKSSSSDKGKAPGEGQSGWGSGGWSKTGLPNQSQTDGWNKSTSDGEDRLSGWNKVDKGDGLLGPWVGPKADAGQNDHGSWDKPRNFEGGRGFGRGRGRDRGTDQGSSWGRGRGGNDGASTYGDQENSWNGQRDFDGGRGTGRGRGRGRYGGRGCRDEDNQDKPSDSGWGWGSGRGRGRGRSGESGSSIDNFDDPRSHGRSGGRGRGRFQSSDWKNNHQDFGDGSFPRNPVSSWGTDQSSGWDKSKDYGKDEESEGRIEQRGWGGWKASENAGGSGKQSSDWKNDEGNNKWSTPKAFGNDQSSCWNRPTSGNNTARCGDTWNSSNPSWNKEQASKVSDGAGGDWASAKHSEGKGPSIWNDNRTAGNEEAVDAGGKWDKAKSSGAKQWSDWNDNQRKETNAGKPHGETSFSDWLPGSDQKNPIGAAGSDNWNKEKPGWGGNAAGASNGNESRAWGGKNSSDWQQNSAAREADKEAGDSGGNGGRPKSSGDWNSDAGSNWNKCKPSSGHQSSSWNDRLPGLKEDGGKDQSEGWNQGRGCGRDQSSGGRGNPFSNRGRGRGRNFGGGQSIGWNRSPGANEEDNVAPTKEAGRSGWQQNDWSGGSSRKDGGSSGWSSGGGFGSEKNVGWGGGSPRDAGQKSGWGLGAANKANAPGDGGSSWEKASGSWGNNAKDGERGNFQKEEKPSSWSQRGSGSGHIAGGSGGWSSGGGFGARKDDGGGGGASENAGQKSGWGHGTATKADAPGGGRGTWEKGAGSWGNAKGGEGKGGW